MTFEGYDAFDDPYCYRGTMCLINRPDYVIRPGLRHSKSKCRR